MSSASSSARNAPAKKGSTVIFGAAKVAAHLSECKARAPDSAWWAEALTFDWRDVRKPAGSQTSWVSIYYTDPQGVKSRLVVRVLNEAHTGQIMPVTDEALARLVSKAKPNSNVKYAKRDKKPAFQVRKWNAQVKTAEDGVSLTYDEEGAPVLPEDQFLSPYYQVAALLGEAFAYEVDERIERGRALLAAALAAAAAAKKAGKPAGAAGEIFLAEHGPAQPGTVILGSEDAIKIRKAVTAPGDQGAAAYNAIIRGVTIVPNTKPAPLVQECLGASNMKAGALLPNPITRIAMNFDDKTGLPAQRLTFFDKSKPFMAGGKKAYEPGTVDGTPINTWNVHEFVVPRCTVDGIVNMDSVCFSNMGLSIPVKLEVGVIEPPVTRERTLDDVYGDEDDEAGPSGEPAAPRGGGESAAEAPAEASAAEDFDDLAGLMGDLSGVTTRA